MKSKKDWGETSDAGAARSSDSGPHVLKLDETLSSQRGIAGIARGQRLLEKAESDPPDGVREPMDSLGEVSEATDKLTGAVDQMVPSILLSLGMLDTAVKWLKLLAGGMGVAFLVAVFIAVRMEIASSSAREAAVEVAESKEAVKEAKLELGRANRELKQIRDDLLSLKAEMAKQAVDQASQPKIVPGDRPGEVAIVTPAINPRELERAKKAAEKAVKAGKEPPPFPTVDKATRIPAQLRPAEVKKLDDAFKE